MTFKSIAVLLRMAGTGDSFEGSGRGSAEVPASNALGPPLELHQRLGLLLESDVEVDSRLAWHILTSNGLYALLPQEERLSMASSLNLSLTDELRAFVDQNSGDGTLYSTPSEFVRDIIRRHKLHEEVVDVHSAIIEGYQDAIAGRTVAFDGDLKGLLKKK